MGTCFVARENQALENRLSRSIRSLLVTSFAWCAVGAVFGQMPYQRIQSFGDTNASAASPHAALIQGADGALYGTTVFGGAANAGTLYRINTDGSGYTNLYNFSGVPDGSNPYGRLVQGPDGFLYGTTAYGGSNNLGTIYKINTNGCCRGILRHFSTNYFDGQSPYGALVLGSNGLLYGTTAGGGPSGWETNYFDYTNGVGTVFSLNTDGTGFTLLHTFAEVSDDPWDGGSDYGYCSPGELIQGADGNLYGEVLQLEYYNLYYCALFSLNPTILTCSILISNFSLPEAAFSHHAGVIQGADGLLYGTSFGDSSSYETSYGAIYCADIYLSNLVTLHSFSTNISDGEYPDSRLFQGTNGMLFGTTTMGGANGYGAVFTINTNGTGFSLLYSFGATATDGQWPSDALLLGNDGNLYGTTLSGGAYGQGSIFKIGQDGSSYAQLHSFGPPLNGQGPADKLVRGNDGLLYGTTIGGVYGNGTVFKIGADGSSYALLHQFGSTNNDGQWPLSGLLRGVDGVFYGMTATGGQSGQGTVFSITSNGGTYQQLYSFNGLPDGNVPSGRLIQGANGALFGVTGAGGSNDRGTVFTLGTNGCNYAVLHQFSTNGGDGWGPVGSLVLGGDGALYGTTADGGASSGGTVFRITPDGNSYSVLYSFSTNGIDGTTPFAGLALGGDGSLYGATRFGGSNNVGTVFRINTNGSQYGLVRTFDYLVGDGQEPFGDLSQGSDGTLYGTTFYGGANTSVTNDDDRGCVFQIYTNGLGYALLQSFSISGGANGENPAAGVTLGADGSLIGSTLSGGDLNAGTLFHLGLGPPQILDQPLDLTVLMGGNAAFNVTASGVGLAYQWLFNGSPLPGAVNSTLQLSGVVRTNGGAYSVQVANQASGTLSSNANLTVQVPQQMGMPLLQPDGTLLIGCAYADGCPFEPCDLDRFEAQFSTNLVDWTDMPDALSAFCGILLLEDLGATNQPVGFYRIIEH